MSITSSDDRPSFREWVIVEQLGHKKLAGFATEATVAGSGFLRLEIPNPGGLMPFTTQYIQPSTIYALTPVAEEVARAVAAAHRPEPVHRWELPPPVSPSRVADVDAPDAQYRPGEELGDDFDDSEAVERASERLHGW